MELGKLVNVKKVIAPLCKEKVSPGLAYKLMKFIRAVEAEESFFNKRQQEIVDEYGLRGADGKLLWNKDGTLRWKDDTIEVREKALKELWELDVDKPKYEFTIEELTELRFSVSDMVIIEDFIKKEE